MGVSFFYVLSGYILGVVYLHDERAIIDRPKFWMARFARIYPAYAFALILRIPFVVAIVAGSGAVAKRLLIAIGTLLGNVFLLQAWIPILNWHWNPPSWSVSAEAFFYLLFPSLAIWSTKVVGHRKRLISIILSYLAMLVPPLVLLAVGIGFNSEPRPVPFLIVVFTPLFRIPEFMIGLLLSGLERGMKSVGLAPGALRFGALATLLLSTATCVAILFYGNHIPFVFRYNGIADLAFAGIIFGLANDRGLGVRMLSHPAVILLGEASYSVYILQGPVFEWYRVVAEKVARYSETVPLWERQSAFACYVVVLVGIAVLTFQYIEAPLRKWIVRWYEKRRAVASPAEIGGTAARVTLLAGGGGGQIVASERNFEVGPRAD